MAQYLEELVQEISKKANVTQKEAAKQVTKVFNRSIRIAIMIVKIIPISNLLSFIVYLLIK